MPPRKITAAAALLALGALAACGGSSPPSASAIVTADGYKLSGIATAAQLGDAAPYVAQMAAGTSSDGKTEQAVIVWRSGDAGYEALVGAYFTHHGLTVATDGLTQTVTGSAADFDTLGG